MAHRLQPEEQPTQCQHSARTVARSSLASAGGVVAVLPVLWPILEREIGPVWGSIALVAAVAGNALVTRILAIPAVEAWLRAVIPPLAASPPDERHHRRLDLAHPGDVLHASAPPAVPATAAGAVVHAERQTRTVSGLVLPWDKIGATTLGELIIAPGGVRLPRDLSRCKLHFKHTGTDGHRPVGYATGYHVTRDGLHMTFKVANTEDGDHALTQVRERVFDAFSAELAAVRREGSTVVDSIMTGVALVDTPAFHDARVTEVHAQFTPPGETPMNVIAFIRALIAAGMTEADARARAAEQFTQAEVDAVTADDLAYEPAGTGDPNTDPNTDPNSAPNAGATGHESVAASFTPRPAAVPAGLTPSQGVGTVVHASAHDAADTLVRLIAGRRGDVAHAALTDITNSGLIDAQPPHWLGELWSGPAKTRRIIPLMNRRDLRSWRIQGFKWTQKPLVAAYAGDKTDIPTNPVDVAPYEAEATRWAGGHDLDRKFFDFGDAGILESYWRAMHESYAIVTDQSAAAFLVANATVTAPLATTDVPPLLAAMYTAASAIDDAVGVGPSYYIANPADRLGLMSVTSQNMPAFFDLLGVDARQIVWSSLVPAGTLVAGAKPAATFHELPGSPLRVEAEHLSHGGRDRAMFGYTALTLDNADGLVKVTFSGGA